MPTTTVNGGQLRLSDITRRFGARAVLDGVDLIVGSRERLGLDGENGSGKSTLLRIAAGRDLPDAGSVVTAGSVGLLPQRIPVDRRGTVGDLLALATAEVTALQAQMHQLEAQLTESDGAELGDILAAYGDLAEEFERREGWTTSARLDATLDEVGMRSVHPSRPLASLSGGERSRLALVALLVRRPTVLLLDEPTTHLDDAAVAYLERQVAGWPGPVVVASHDRAFLDAVCTAVVDLDASRSGGLTRYGGAYSAYLAAKSVERARWQQAYAQWQEEHARLTRLSRAQNVRVGHPERAPRDNDKSLANLFKGSSELAVARRTKDAQVRLHRLEGHAVAKSPEPLRFLGAQSSRRTSRASLLGVRDVVVHGRIAVRALDVSTDTRLLVTGPNGSGKSSLLAVLSGALRPRRGTVQRAGGVRVGVLEQQTHWPNPRLNVLSAFASGRDGNVDDHVRALLDVGVLHPRELSTPVGRLSVGQQRRVALARLVADDPDVLLLDEPTDHLSLSLVEELEEALRARGGPLVVVSHDRWLRRTWDGETRDVRTLA
jgi:macrolide transport system ATP-binding/permease protein